MTFKMWDLQDIGLRQWNQVGDHPDVTALSDPKYELGHTCMLCGKPYSAHGLIKNPNYPTATSYDHFHGKNATTVCPSDYVYTTVNDKGIKQAVVIPEKMFNRINDSIGTSYKERIVNKGITEIIFREYYSKEFKLNSDLLDITNTEFKHHTDNHTLDVELNKITTVAIDDTVTIGGNRTVSVTKNLFTSIKGNQTTTVIGDSVFNANNFNVNTDTDIVLNSKANIDIVGNNGVLIATKLFYGDRKDENELGVMLAEIKKDIAALKAKV